MFKKFFLRVTSFFVIFFATILILVLYSTQAERLGLLPVIDNQIPSQTMTIFSLLLTIPVVVILAWPHVINREILLPMRIAGVRYRVIVTKWRVAFIIALAGLALLQFL